MTELHHDDAALLALGEAFRIAREVEQAASDDDHGAAFAALNAIVEAIAVQPAMTLDGLKVRARAFGLWYGDGMNDAAAGDLGAFSASIAEDVWRLMAAA